jgi:hypothetical protein
LSATVEAFSDDATTKHTHVRVVLELHDDARAPRQLSGAVTENRIQLVAKPTTRLS